MKLSKAQEKIIRALIKGATLKSHRYLDGKKIYKLHPLQGAPETVQDATVESLKTQGLIDSNQKFPAATYLLTEKGRQLADALEAASIRPISAKNY
jgi:hypothetical protein